MNKGNLKTGNIESSISFLLFYTHAMCCPGAYIVLVTCHKAAATEMTHLVFAYLPEVRQMSKYIESSPLACNFLIIILADWLQKNVLKKLN